MLRLKAAAICTKMLNVDTVYSCAGGAKFRRKFKIKLNFIRNTKHLKHMCFSGLTPINLFK